MSSNSKIILGILIVVIVGVGAYFLGKNASNAQASIFGITTNLGSTMPKSPSGPIEITATSPISPNVPSYANAMKTLQSMINSNGGTNPPSWRWFPQQSAGGQWGCFYVDDNGRGDWTNAPCPWDMYAANQNTTKQ